MRRIAERYVDHPAIVMWHVGNEFGCHLSMDFSDAARDAYREWLRARYDSIDALNDAWGTNFWSQRYGDFDEIFPPRLAPYSHNPSSMLDFRRFTSDMLLECYLMEREILLAAGATQPITTNFMGPFKPADYSRWAPFMDVIADDCYPDPTNPNRVRDAAFQRDLVRSLKPGVPWLLWEQATDAVNWRPANPGKRPGALMAETAQSIARGADGIMFFQWRQSRAGSEKFHSAMLPHAGTETSTWQARHRTRRAAGRAARPARTGSRRPRRAGVRLGELVGDRRARPPGRVRLPRAHARVVRRAARAGCMVDIVAPEQVDDGYDLVVAPALYLLRDEGAAALSQLRRGRRHAADGSVHRHRRRARAVPRRRLPHPARARCSACDSKTSGHSAAPSTGGTGVGAQAERSAGEGDSVGFRIDDVAVSGRLVAEIVHPAGASVVASFADGLAAGSPALTRHPHGRARPGTSRRCPTPPDSTRSWARWSRHPVSNPSFQDCLRSVEAARRGDLVTLINHGDEPAEVFVDGTDAESGEHVGRRMLEPQGVLFALVPSVAAAAAPASTVALAPRHASMAHWK